jgi:hypothetical protein
MIKSRRIRQVKHVSFMGDGEGAYRVFVKRPEGKKPLGRPRHRWEENIKMNLMEVGWGGMDWIALAEDRDGCQELVNAVMNLRVPQNVGISLLDEDLLASQEGRCSMESVARPWRAKKNPVYIPEAGSKTELLGPCKRSSSG